MVGRKTSLIQVQDTPISILSMNQDDYICITDMAKQEQILCEQLML